MKEVEKIYPENVETIMHALQEFNGDHRTTAALRVANVKRHKNRIVAALREAAELYASLADRIEEADEFEYIGG